MANRDLRCMAPLAMSSELISPSAGSLCTASFAGLCRPLVALLCAFRLWLGVLRSSRSASPGKRSLGRRPGTALPHCSNGWQSACIAFSKAFDDRAVERYARHASGVGSGGSVLPSEYVCLKPDALVSTVVWATALLSDGFSRTVGLCRFVEEFYGPCLRWVHLWASFLRH